MLTGHEGNTSDELDEKCKEILSRVDEDLAGIHLKVKSSRWIAPNARNDILKSIDAARKYLKTHLRNTDG